MGKGWNTVKRLRSQGFIHYVKVATHLRLPCHGQFAMLQAYVFSQGVGGPQTRADVVAPSRKGYDGRFFPSIAFFRKAKIGCPRLRTYCFAAAPSQRESEGRYNCHSDGRGALGTLVRAKAQ